MLGTFALLITAATVPDPRLALVEMQLAGRSHEALAVVQQTETAHPDTARQLGFDYLRGHLLQLLGKTSEATDAFAQAMGATPRLSSYCRYRLALEQEKGGHPEVAAGLISRVPAADAASPILPEAVRLFVRTLGHGGDCRLLRSLDVRTLPTPERRQLLVAWGDCTLRAGQPDAARATWAKLLDETREDDAARQAAERLSAVIPEDERGRLPLILGLTFTQHREFERALRLFRRSLGAAAGDEAARGATPQELAEGRFAFARSLFWEGRYAPAAAIFGALAERAESPASRARALYQQARCYEIMASWKAASASFRLAFLADSAGEWAAPALFSALRIEWRLGNEPLATAVYDQLTSRDEWRETARRAALFLAASDLTRSRGDRARPWLDFASTASRPATAEAETDDRLEVGYWRGRLAELEQDPPAAVAAYLAVLRADPFHPFARAAHNRLQSENLSRNAAAAGRRLAASRRIEDVYGAWLLLGDDSKGGRAALAKLRRLLAADRVTAPFLHLHEVPVARWPLWKRPLRQPEEMLLALGALQEGAPAIAGHFPVSDPSLAYTGCLLLSRASELSRSILHAEALRLHMPDRLPLTVLPRAYRQILYPLAYREALLAESRRRRVDPYLLAAIVRAESRFDAESLSPAAARGLAQLVFPTARRIAAHAGLPKLDIDDLYRPRLSIGLGATYLSELLHNFPGAPYAAVAAYNAGEPQALLWQHYCNTTEPEEYLTKVAFRETRSYLGRVLSNWEHYQALYRDQPAATAAAAVLPHLQ